MTRLQKIAITIAWIWYNIKWYVIGITAFGFLVWMVFTMPIT